ncbi:MAG: hypothetical protein AB7T07_05145 [Steroidobacteraceae bacterium]
MAERAEKVLTLHHYVAVLRRRWPYLATIIPAALLLAVLLAFTLPAIYSSSATILLEASSIDPSLIKTTVVSYADQQIELVRRDVMTTDRLEDVVKQVDPYPDRVDLSTRDKAVRIANETTIQKVDPVTLEPLVVSSAFSIKYSNASPKIAAEVAQHLADMFLTANRAARTAQALDTYNFMLAKSRELEAQIRANEQRLAEFKARYGGALPEVAERNETRLDRTEREIESIRAQIRLVEQQESLLKLQLSQMSPTLITANGGDLFTQLGTLRAQLAEAQQKYTPDHPDVKRLTRAIEALSEQAKLGNPQNIRPDNPDYLRVSSELNAVRTNLAALRSTLERAQGQVSQYETRLSMAPGVERDYLQLTRDREVLQQEFQVAQSKLREADMSKSLESQAKGERYTLIRKPYVPSKPDSPNRLGIILLGMVLGGGLAAGLAAFRESADPTVRTSEDVTDMVDLPLIAAIPKLQNPANRRRQHWLWGSVAGAYLLATIAVGLAVIYAHRS